MLKENKISLKIGICLVMLLTIVFPTRGEILGLGGGTILLMCCVGCIIVQGFKIKKVSIPIFYIIYVVLNVICMLYHKGDRSYYINLIETMNIIGVTYIILSSIKTKIDFDKFIDYIVYIFMIYAILGIIESFFHWNFFDLITHTEVVYKHANELRFGLARSRGATDISINNGMLLCLVLCIVAYKLINSNYKKRRIYFIAYILIFINAFCTLSRGIWIDLFLSQILIFLSLKSSKKLKVIFKIVMVAMTIFILGRLVAPNLIDKVFDIFNEMIGSIINVLGGSAESSMADEGDRVSLWGWVWSSVQNKALWGLGYDAKFAYLTKAGAVKESIEVMWLYRLYQTGFMGLLSYIFFQLGSIIYATKKMMKKRKREKVGFNYIFIVASIAYFITQFSCCAVEDLRFYYIMLSLLFCYNTIDKRNLKERLD